MSKEEKRFVWADLSTHILMFLTLFGTLIWFRAESREDWKHMDQKIDSYMNGIQQEIKDFHGRLCAIEEKNRGK